MMLLSLPKKPLLIPTPFSPPRSKNCALKNRIAPRPLRIAMNCEETVDNFQEKDLPSRMKYEINWYWSIGITREPINTINKIIGRL
jgi:hypothetical protein